MFYVKVSGETLGELRLGLLAKLNEIDNREVKTPRSFAVTSSADEDDSYTESGEEMEAVESPYAKTQIDTSTVVDNEKDTEGLPWDSRIHSGGKSVNKDGTWKLKKGVDKAVVAQVKAELLYRGAGTTLVNTQAQYPVQQEPAKPIGILEQVHQAPVQQPVAQPVQASPALPPNLPQVVAGHTLQSFQNQFSLVMSALITQGKITQEYVNTLRNHFGVEVYMFNADQQAAVFHEFVKCGIIQQVG